MENDDTIFMWWGIDATETDIQTWHSFQEAMTKAFEGKVHFVEVHTKAQAQEMRMRLEQEWRTIGRGGSGAFSRIFPWAKGNP